jgi:hypothetical protein
MWSGSWSAAMQAHCAGRTLRDKPEDHHWDWKWKAGERRPMLGYHSFAITSEGELQGLMLVSDLKSARIQAQFGKPIVYVEFVATAGGDDDDAGLDRGPVTNGELDVCIQTAE